VTKKLTGTELKRLHRDWRRQTEGRVALLLDGVQNPYNVGAIVRTAAAFGVDHLYLAGSTASPTAAVARKISMGTERYLEWSQHDDGAGAVGAAVGDGFTVVGVELTDDARPMHVLALPEDVCLALGHEEHGLSAGCLRAIDLIAYLPQTGRVGSLNVATAAALAVYEARRHAWSASGTNPVAGV
jgi:tRNA (guanosine-2'-O-)-methyltransferase